MKRWIILSVLLLTGLQADQRGLEIVERITALMSPENSQGIATQTIETSSGQLRTFEMEMYSANKGEKSLMRYTKPANVRGQTFLMLNNADDIWSYSPRPRRVRKLASHAKKQKIQGSDFTYEDMGSGDTWLKKYEASYLGTDEHEGVACWKVELVGIPEEEPPYPRMLIWARQEDSYPVYMEYYKDNGEILKALHMENIQDIEGYPTAMRMTMENLEDHTQTVMENLSITYDWTPPPGFFSERNLRK